MGLTDRELREQAREHVLLRVRIRLFLELAQTTPDMRLHCVALKVSVKVSEVMVVSSVVLGSGYSFATPGHLVPAGILAALKNLFSDRLEQYVIMQDSDLNRVVNYLEAVTLEYIRERLRQVRRRRNE